MVDKEKLRAICKDAVYAFGHDAQLMQFYEEMGELMTAISHMKRGRVTKASVEEEIGDVFLCIEQLKWMFDLSDDNIDVWMKHKLERLQQRIERKKELEELQRPV